jgi:hypothetical protein
VDAPSVSVAAFGVTDDPTHGVAGGISRAERFSKASQYGLSLTLMEGMFEIPAGGRRYRALEDEGAVSKSDTGEHGPPIVDDSYRQDLFLNTAS